MLVRFYLCLVLLLCQMYDFFSTLGWVTDKDKDFMPNGSSNTNGGVP